jgi:hypothetical protein
MTSKLTAHIIALQDNTFEKLEDLCWMTYRSTSDLIDYLVAKEYQNLIEPLQMSAGAIQQRILGQAEPFQTPEIQTEEIQQIHK